MNHEFTQPLNKTNLLLFVVMVMVVMVVVARVAGQDAGSSIGRGQDEKKKGSGGLKWERDGRLNEWAINQGVTRVTWVFARVNAREG